MKILADTTQKTVYFGIIIFTFTILLALYGIAAFAVPDTFIELKGNDECDFTSSFKGLCHKMDFEDDGYSWVSYLGKFEKKNQFLLIGGEIIRKYPDP